MTPSAAVLYGRLVSGGRVRHLQAFVAVAELGSAKRAGESIGASQPAVTSLIADLEQLLECALFLRHARGMQMTDIAQELLPFVRRALASLERGADFVTFRRTSESSIVRVGGIVAALNGLLVRALPPFIGARPDVSVEVQEAVMTGIASLILRQEIDMLLCREPAVQPEGWEFVELMQDRLVVVTGPQHPLVAKPSLGFVDLCDEVWLQMPSPIPARTVFDTLMNHHGINPQYRNVTTLSPSIAMAQLRSERVVGLAPYSVFRQLVELGQLAVLDVVDMPPFQPLGVLSPKDEEMSKAALDFKGFLFRYAKQHP
ncbi:LysR family transcriptional regulator [Variovorax sp. 38R]|uniref:LysR family transcriptional regulator n=1 Tax=Variovorax sp. 38R TaxID=2774875 RepID=UPI0017829045|nr:LysR family transcriptional regulator [Variovorax sp. 38R]QOF77558.1 LysR family transcriptional regulator [Variovorax sp. 38R]